MICKNDKSATYKGDEPSPKGLGWCAHAEKVGSKMVGLDGHTWVVEATSSGVKRWVKAKTDETQQLFTKLDMLLKKKKLDATSYKVFQATVNALYDIYDSKKKDAGELFYTITNAIERTPKLSPADVSFSGEIVIVDPTSVYNPYTVLNVKPGIWKAYYHQWAYPAPNLIVAVHSGYAQHTREDFIYEFHASMVSVDKGPVIMMNRSLYPKFSDPAEELNWVKNIMWDKSNKTYRISNAYYAYVKTHPGSYHYSVGRIKEGGEIVKIILHFV